jgi:hypothetical protein
VTTLAREFHLSLIDQALLAGGTHALAGPPRALGEAYGLYADYWRRRGRTLMARATREGLVFWLESTACPRRRRRPHRRM